MFLLCCVYDDLEATYATLRHLVSSQQENSSGLLHLFVDNSSVFIQAKSSVPLQENILLVGSELPNVRVDYGRLLLKIKGTCEIGVAPWLIGSRPPPDDTVWNAMRDHGFEVKVLPCNCKNKEKAVDTGLVEAMKRLYTQPVGILVLVAGDGDYAPLIDTALEQGWKVEIFFWNSGESLFPLLYYLALHTVRICEACAT